MKEYKDYSPSASYVAKYNSADGAKMKDKFSKYLDNNVIIEENNVIIEMPDAELE
jgi:hypothetical protein